MAKTDPDQSQQFNTMLLTAAIIAGILALGIIWMIYGCAQHSSPPKPRQQSPGMYLMLGSW
jgi:heme/copper-type cytochrome/quinol oxidase subunit 4